MDWDDFKYFSALAHSGSVRQAAGFLGVHASTVMRRLDHFERHLGVTLFNRTPGGIQITPEGAEVIHRVDEVAEELAEIQRRLQYRNADMAGPLKLTIADMFLENLIAHDFATFTARYPDVQLVFIPENRHPNLDRHETDLVIRLTDNPPEHLVGRRFGKYTAAIYGSRNYLNDHDPWVNPQMCRWLESSLLADAAAELTIEGETSEIPTLATLSGSELKPTHFSTMPTGARFDNLPLQLAAIRGEMGIGILPCSLGDTDPGLMRLPGMSPFELQEVWMLIHPDLRSLVRVQVMLEFLQQRFRDHRERLLGVTAMTSNSETRLTGDSR